MIEATHSVPTPAPAPAPDPESLRLRQISREFEAVLTAAMLKDGLKSATTTWGDEESDAAQQTMMDFVHEQLAYHIGQQGVLGIANTVSERLEQLLGDKHG